MARQIVENRGFNWKYPGSASRLPRRTYRTGAALICTSFEAALAVKDSVLSIAERNQQLRTIRVILHHNLKQSATLHYSIWRELTHHRAPDPKDPEPHGFKWPGGTFPHALAAAEVTAKGARDYLKKFLKGVAVPAAEETPAFLRITWANVSEVITGLEQDVGWLAIAEERATANTPPPLIIPGALTERPPELTAVPATPASPLRKEGCPVELLGQETRPANVLIGSQKDFLPPKQYEAAQLLWERFSSGLTTGEAEARGIREGLRGLAGRALWEPHLETPSGVKGAHWQLRPLSMVSVVPAP